jgi:hypothetical protein
LRLSVSQGKDNYQLLKPFYLHIVISLNALASLIVKINRVGGRLFCFPPILFFDLSRHRVYRSVHGGLLILQDSVRVDVSFPSYP